MATAANMGGLFATVDLDTRKALKNIRQLQGEFTKLFNGTKAASGPPKFLGPPLSKTILEAKRAEQALRGAADAAGKVGTNLNKTGTAAAATARKVKLLGDGFHTVANNAGNVFTSLSLATRRGGGIGAFSNSLRTISSLFRGAAGSGAAFGLAVGAVVVGVVAGVIALKSFTSALSKLIRESLSTGQTLETLLVSFEALLGSAKRAKEEFRFITDAAKVSPFFTEDIVKLDRFLLAQGVVNDELRRNTVQSLIQFGAAAGLTGDKLQDLAYALGQVFNAQRLTGDEARQLRNNMLGVVGPLRTLPQYADLTSAAILDLAEAGKISAKDFFEAFARYTAQFGDAATKQQQTLRGLKDTILDVFQLGLGAAAVELADVNEQFSVLGALRAPLRDLLIVIEDLDFRPLAMSLGAVVSTGLKPLADFVENEGTFIKNFFQRTLPRAILLMVNVFRIVYVNWVAILKAFFGVFRAFSESMFGIGNTATSVANIVLFAFSALGKFVIIGIAPAIAAFSVFLAALQAVAGGLLALFQIALGVMKGFASLFGGGSFFAGFADAGEKAWTSLKAGWSGAFDTLKAGMAGLRAAWEATNAKPIELPSVYPGGRGGRGKDTPQGDPFGGGSGTEEAAANAAKAAQDIAKAQNTIFELLQRFAGLRSALEEGFLGKGEGFSASIDQIADMGQKVIEALNLIGGAAAKAAANKVYKMTLQLIELAKLREKAVDALKEAEKNLESILAERDKLASSIADTSKKFATALTTESTVTKKLENFSSRGFFYETEVTKQKSFLQSLRERAQALINFRAGLTKLAAAGLDPQLIADLASAGPEAAGDAVAELASSSSGAIKEVNSLYAEIGNTAEALGEQVAGSLFDTSVAAAQSVVTGLTSDLESITAAAEAITATIYAALEPFAKEMEEVGSAGGSGMADGLNDSFGDIEGAMGDIGGTIDTSLQGMNSSFKGARVGAVSEFRLMGGELVGEFVTMFGKIKDKVELFVGALKLTFGGLGERIGDWFEKGDTAAFIRKIALWWYGKVMPKWKTLIDFLQTKFVTGLWNVLLAGLKAIGLFPHQTIGLPLSVSATNFYNSMVDAINFFIRAYNKILFLPPIPLLNKKGGSSGSSTWGSVPKIPPSSTLPSANDPIYGQQLSVNVYLSDKELTELVMSEVTTSNTRTATSLSTGRMA